MSHILIVDDEEDIRNILSEFLEFQNFTCDTVGSVKEAKEYIQNNNYDLIISDIIMPEEKGDVLLRWLNEMPEYKMKLVFMTGYSDVPREELLELGALEIVSKPFNLMEFSDKIKNQYI